MSNYAGILNGWIPAFAGMTAEWLDSDRTFSGGGLQVGAFDLVVDELVAVGLHVVLFVLVEVDLELV